MFHSVAAVMLTLTVFSLPAVAAETETTPAADESRPVLTANLDASWQSTASRPDALRRQVTSRSIARPGVLPALYVSLSALQAFDVYSTLTALKHGAMEANPLMQEVVRHPATFIALKASVTGASIYTAEKLWQENKKAQAILIMVASNGFMAYVAHQNTRVLRAIR